MGGLFNARKYSEGWTVVPIESNSEEETARVLQRASVYMSGSFREGFGMPPAEAMACGCLVVGWHGSAGEEFFRPGICLHAEEGDTLSLFSKMKEAMSYSPEKIVDIGQIASTFIRAEYSTAKEIESISSAWENILEDNVPQKAAVEVVNPDPSDRMKGVAAFVSTYDEGPYLERCLRWLSGRVERVYVIESKSSFFGSHVPENRRTKDIVDYVSHLGNIFYHELEGVGLTPPDIKEASERNQAIEMIQEDGFKWIWIVDSDEFYEDKEADALWRWFFREGEVHNPDIMGARCTWLTYWRSLQWRVDPPEDFHPNVIIRSDCRIASSRHLLAEQEARIVDVPEQVCMPRHYSWAHTPEDIQKKISTWTHGHQVVPTWFERIFMEWEPGDGVENFHPTQPEAYKKLVRCERPLPEALEGHPYTESEVIGPVETERLKVKVVILNHNNPENSDKLFDALGEAFDDVEIFDSGSDPERVAVNTTRSFENIYWTGAWNKIMETCGDYDAVWMLAGDVELRTSPIKYRQSIDESMPFGIWSPAISGRAQPFMQASCFGRSEEDAQKVRVKNVEGISFAASKELMRAIGQLEGSPIGYGQDFWMCRVARENGLPNYIDGKVVIHHPAPRGYDDDEASGQMDETFGRRFGQNYRKTVFEYSESFGGNHMNENIEQMVIATVDNGWGYPAFIRITDQINNVRRIVMVKGAAPIPAQEGVEVIPYDASLTEILSQADAVLFPVVGDTTRKDFLKLLHSGIPVVAKVDAAADAIKHERSGFVYEDGGWAVTWLQSIQKSPSIREGISDFWRKENSGQTEKAIVPEAIPTAVPSKSGVKVTVITPTWGRDPDVIKRCIDSLRLQTLVSWEQLVCSNGAHETPVLSLVERIGDERVRYFSLGEEPGQEMTRAGDYGNSARKKMIKIAAGEHIVFVDDDNIVLPTFLEEMASSLGNAPDCDFAVCDIMHFGPLREDAVGPAPAVLTGEPVKLHHIDPLQVMVRTGVMQKVGWDTEAGYLSDGVTLEKLGDRYKHVKVNKLLGIHI